ncbi:MAG: alpha/beta hydrolase [Elusimicrobiota bacterium]
MTRRLALALLWAMAARASAEPVKVKSFDGFELGTTASAPPGLSDADVKRVVVFVSGSGPQNRDEDLTSVSAPGTKNLFFVDVSNALANRGFATVRYDKRSFEMARRAKADPAFKNSEAFKKFGRRPLSSLIEDARRFVAWAHQRYPNARVYLLGHSEGTYVALQEAKNDPLVSGLAMIGFFAQSMDTAIVEQVVYRNVADFDALDKNHDGALDEMELSGDGPLQKTLISRKALLDLNQDGLIQRSEFMAGNYANFLLDDPKTHIREYRIEQSNYPRPAELIATANFPISFFQGELDNQTPAYAAKAVQLLNTLNWHKTNLTFHFFSGLGHALDPRTSYQDIVFRPVDPAALTAMATELDAIWRD